MMVPDLKAVENRVREQYERYPFPDYTKVGPKGATLANSDDPARLNSALFGGRADPSRWSILVAGGGTGEKTLGLALLTRPFGTNIVHLDLSSQSINIAQNLCKEHDIKNVEFVQGSIYEIPDILKNRQFDYIQCMGVLHHLPDPQMGLDVLTQALTDDGALSLAVYADVGRTAVYLARQTMGLLMEGSDTLSEGVALARSAMERLPKTNWLRSDPNIMTHLQRHGDNALVDAILHAQDVAYDAYSFHKLLSQSGLIFVDHCEPCQKFVYDLQGYDFPAALNDRVAAMPELKRKRFLELFHGRLVVQSAYVSKKPTHRAPFVDDMIPHQTIFANVRWKLSGDGRIEIVDNRFGGISLPISRMAVEYLRRIDNRRTTGSILDDIIAQGTEMTDRDEIRMQLESDLKSVFHYDLISLCDRPFRVN